MACRVVNGVSTFCASIQRILTYLGSILRFCRVVCAYYALFKAYEQPISFEYRQKASSLKDLSDTSLALEIETLVFESFLLVVCSKSMGLIYVS